MARYARRQPKAAAPPRGRAVALIGRSGYAGPIEDYVLELLRVGPAGLRPAHAARAAALDLLGRTAVTTPRL